MKTTPTTPEDLYSRAYAAHYTSKNLLDALHFYALVVIEHPDSAEARNAALQIHNIKARSAPAPEVVRADLMLAIEHISDEVPQWLQEMYRDGGTPPQP